MSTLLGVLCLIGLVAALILALALFIAIGNTLLEILDWILGDETP